MEGQDSRALIIGWDGVRHDLLDQLELPARQRIAEAGVLRRTEMPDVDLVTRDQRALRTYLKIGCPAELLGAH